MSRTHVSGVRTLDKTRDFATVYGGVAKYSQDGFDFDAAGNQINVVAQKKEDMVIETDQLDSAEMFLKNILKEPLSKAAVYKTSEANNQRWDDVRNAAVRLGIIKFKFGGAETWKLPEEHR